MKKILVSGSNGFICSSIVKLLPYKFYAINDVNNISESFNDTFDYAINFAAISGIKKCKDNRLKAVKVNVIGLINFIRFCIKNNIKNIIFPSSASVYSPKSIYSFTKLLGEIICFVYSKTYNLNIICLRLYNIYDFDKSQSIINKIYKKELSLKDLDKKNKYLDFLHINDLVVLFDILISSKFIKYKRFDVGSGKKYNIAYIKEAFKNNNTSYKYKKNKKVIKTFQHFNWFPKIDVVEEILKINKS